MFMEGLDEKVSEGLEGGEGATFIGICGGPFILPGWGIPVILEITRIVLLSFQMPLKYSN